MDSVENQLENIFLREDRDRFKPSFGLFEQRLAQLFLIVFAIPILFLPYIFKLANRKILYTFCILILYLVIVFLIVQFRFGDFVFLSHKLDQLIDTIQTTYARIRN